MIFRYLNSFVKTLNKPGVKTAGIFSGGNLIVAFLNAAAGIFVARWIAPEVLGELAKYAILTSYLGFGLIPIHAAFQRHYLFYTGKGDKPTAIDIASTAKWWYVFFSWVCTFVFIVLIIRSAVQQDYRAVAGWSVQIPVIWMIIYGAYLNVLFRTSGDFRKLAYIKLISAFSAAFFLVFVRFFEYWGLASKHIIKNLSNIFFLFFFRPEKIKSKFNPKKLISLAKISIPLEAPSYFDTKLLLGTIKFFILSKLGEESLGIYAMALTINGFVMVFSNSMSQIITTKISLKHGQTNDVFKSLQYAFKPTMLVLLLTTIMAAGFSFMIDPLMTIYTPNYIKSIPVIQILVWQLPLSALKYPLVVLTAALWYKAAIVLRMTKVLVSIILLFLFAETVVSIAWILVISDILFLLISYGYLAYVKVFKS